MPNEYDKKAVQEVLRKHGRWAKLEGDPELQERVENIFREHGWVPENGQSALGTFAEYARKANSRDMNGAREVFGKQYDEDEIVSQLATRTRLGSPSTIRRMLEVVDAADMHDGLLERLAQRDHSGPPREEPSAEAKQAEENHRRLTATFERAAFRSDAHTEARQEAFTAALPSDREPSLRDSVEAALVSQEQSEK